MKRITKKLIAAASCFAALALTACSTGITVTLDENKPWTAEGSTEPAYEKLVYSVAIYDVDGSSRTQIASGALTYELDASDRQSDGKVQYSELAMDFYVTYNESAAAKDVGKTDTISSLTEFQSSSLVTSKMKKTVSLSPREGEPDNSYIVEADYFDQKTAKRTLTGGDNVQTSVMSIPSGTFYDNELMFYLARSTDLVNGGGAFYMSNVYEAFNSGEFKTYTMTAGADNSTVNFTLGEWAAAFGVEGVENGDGEVTYPVSCYNVDIRLSEQKHGPPYVVYYTTHPFKQGDIEHKKVPVFMSYSEFTGTKLTRVTEYTLTGCAFIKD